MEVRSNRHQTRRIERTRVYWRNVRPHALHDPVFYKAREIGEYFLSKRAPEFRFYS
jgi:hypothetical protein